MNNVIRLDLIPIRLKLMLGGSLLLMSAVAWIVSLSMLDGMAVEMLGLGVDRDDGGDDVTLGDASRMAV